MERDFFEKNIVAIIPESGEIIGVERNPREKFHSEVFERIDKEIIPNFLDDFILVPEAYGGHDYATVTAMNGKAIFIPVSMNDSSSMIVAVPNIMTTKQKNSVEELLGELDNSIVYLLECINNSQDHIEKDKSNIKTYIYDRESIKTLDNIIDLEIIDNNNKGGIK